jgi:5'-3' exonuclease
MARLHTFVFSAVLLICTGASYAQVESQDMLDRAAALVEQAVERLQLTDEQFEIVEPIVRTGAEKRIRILQKYGVIMKEGEERKKISRKDRKKLKGEIDDIRADTAKSLDVVLNDTQMAEYELMLKEARSRIRELAKSRAEEAKKEKEALEQ